MRRVEKTNGGRVDTHGFFFCPMERSHSAALAAELGDQSTVRWLSGVSIIRSPAAALVLIDEINRREREGVSLHRIFASPDSDVLGSIGVDLRSTEIGFWISRDHRGRGFGRHMLNLFIETVIPPSLPYLTACVHEENTPSISLLRACGFAFLLASTQPFGSPPDPANALLFSKVLAVAESRSMPSGAAHAA